MKSIRFIFLSIFLVCISLLGFAAVPPTNLVPIDSLSVAKPLNLFQKGSNKQIEKLIGRRLTVKEKLGLWAARKMKAVDEASIKKANSKALTGFLLSLAGIFVFPLLPSIAAVVLTSSVLKQEKLEPGTLTKNKDLAQIGLVIGILGIIIGFLALLLLIILLSYVRYR